MNLKSLLIFAACGTMLTAAAQSHHGYFMTPSMNAIQPYLDNVSGDITLNCWTTPQLIMPMEKADKTVESSNIYYNNSSDMIVRPSTMNDTKKKYYEKLTGTSVTPNVTADNFKNGYLEVTVPSQMDYPRTDANTPNWQPMPAENNVMNFHICLGGEPKRINDAGNTLSATGEEAYLKGCTGVYVGIKAPAGCTVKAFLNCSSLSEKNYGKDTSGINWNPNFYGTVSTTAFDFADVCDGTYKEMTSGAPYNCLAGMDYSSPDWPKGYCVKYLDIAVYGVKPGDVIGFGGIQTLHEGWTPKAFVTPGSGVNDINIDNTNAPVEIYNLNGVRVNNDNLAPGVYVKRQGTETSKFIVK